MKNILIIKGGVSNEHEVSLKSGQMVADNLDKNKYVVTQIVIEKNGLWIFGGSGVKNDLPSAIKIISQQKYDTVFIALHGFFGEDGHIQAILDSVDISYTGSGMLASALAMNKHLSNCIFKSAKLNVPNYQIITRGDEYKFNHSVVVKPLEGGSSVGVSIVSKLEELLPAMEMAFAESKEIMVQDFIKGREFTCGVIENEQGKEISLSPIEIVPKISNFFDYKAKYQDGGSDEIVNPKIGNDKIEKIKEMALCAHQVLECKGFSRTDFIEKDDKFYIIETNTIPGFTKNSLLPKSANGSGIEFSKLLDIIIGSSLRRKG